MFLADLVVVFAVTAVVVFAFGRARLPSVVGLLVSGVLVGPYGLSLVADVESVELLAEIGVIVLLFTVGLEFSMSKLVVMLPLMGRIGLPQVVGTTALVTLATWWYLGTLPQAVFAGLLVAMSSTAIVLKLLADRGETSTPHGRIAVAVLLLQDLLVVAAMLAVPLLADAAGTKPPADATLAGGAGHGAPLFANPIAAVLVGLAVVAAVLVAGRRVVPAVLHEVVRQRNRELFLITVVLVCLGTAAITAQVGLSLALGAFLAGLSLAESEYGYQAFTEVLPFRDTLASLFFVSVGMIFDPLAVVQTPWALAATLAIVLVAKPLAALVIMAVLGYPLRTAMPVAVSLAQIGEFSFLLASLGKELGVVPDAVLDCLVATAIVSITINPLVYRWSDALAGWAARSRTAVAPAPSPEADDETEAAPRHRAVVVGYGPVGQTVTELLLDNEIEPTVIELNLDTVRRLRAFGVQAIYGDASRPEILAEAGIAAAENLILTSGMSTVDEEIVRRAKELNPRVHILARSHYVRELPRLRKAGAEDAFSGEGEVALAFTARILERLGATGEQIDRERERVEKTFREG